MQKILYSIRPVRDEDIPQVTEIDREAFPGEWLFRSYTSYKQEIHNSLAHYIVACTESEVRLKLDQGDSIKVPWVRRFLGYRRTMLAEEAQNNIHTKEYILGFAGLWAMLSEAHIIAIAVRNDYRQMGIGEGLLISLIEMAGQLNTNVITLEVRASNELAQTLYKKYGFRVVGKRSRYYSDNGEDATLMSTDNVTLAPFQADFQQLKEAYRRKWGIFTTQSA